MDVLPISTLHAALGHLLHPPLRMSCKSWLCGGSWLSGGRRRSVGCGDRGRLSPGLECLLGNWTLSSPTAMSSCLAATKTVKTSGHPLPGECPRSVVMVSRFWVARAAANGDLESVVWEILPGILVLAPTLDPRRACCGYSLQAGVTTAEVDSSRESQRHGGHLFEHRASPLLRRRSVRHSSTSFRA